MCKVWHSTNETTPFHHCSWVRSYVQYTAKSILTTFRPGEKLPSFPAPTHGPDALPYVTIKDAISNIPRLADNHDPENIAFQDGRTRVPYDENTLAKTITCGGGEGNYHPSGLRPFTIRELACLQTFPVQYRFPTAYAKKQVGNSVPPRLAEVIYRAAIKSLQVTDEKECQEDADPIVID